MEPNKRGFTFIEVCIVLICISTLVIGCVSAFRYHKQSQQAEIFVQEAILLRNAFISYWETYRSFPTISEKALTDAAFEKIKPHWYPFNPGNSNLKGCHWVAKTSNTLNDIYILLKRPTNVSLKNDLIQKKINRHFFFETSTGKCFIFKVP
ncbi:MAG: type II secretion system GspH family protein [Puniceicoccales bacterium]|jgi:type II secretory pathway pseudopilin PulG|nr:type II secretion system GspH family protein [Puniceicoccales bacterium]